MADKFRIFGFLLKMLVYKKCDIKFDIAFILLVAFANLQNLMQKHS